MYHYLIIPFLFISFALGSQPPSQAKLKTLYNSLDPLSISQHLSLYELYPETEEGQRSLQNAWVLLTGNCQQFQGDLNLPITLSNFLNALVGIINKRPDDHNYVELSDQELDLIDQLGSRLYNRKLQGYQAIDENFIQTLSPEQIDLSRGVLLSQLGNSQEFLRKIRSYEAMLDLMALQILTRISFKDSPKNKIKVMNQFIFEELGFRFPPHSTYAKEIDLYTFLPSVLDSHRGVCLGVSILYLSLAQRLNLNLEIVTPPGHIFVRWRKGSETINIETTARGVNVPNETYLGLETRKLQERNIKETIGLAHFNQASIYLENQDYDQAMKAYLKAKIYLGEDKHLTGFIASVALLQKNEIEAKKLFAQLIDYLPDHAVSKDTLAEDYLNGKVLAEGIAAMFSSVDETRESLLAKKSSLETVLKKMPQFREGIFSLAGVWLQLHRTDEALKVLKRYHEIDPNYASVEYYLAALYTERLDYAKAWQHLKIAEKLLDARDHHPKALKELRKELAKQSPETI